MPSSVRFDNPGGTGANSIKRTTGLPVLTATTIAFWLRINDYADWSEHCAFVQSGGARYFYMESNNAGECYLITRNGTGQVAQTSNFWTDSRTSWQYIAATSDGTTARIYWRSESETSLNTASHTYNNGVSTPDQLQFGGDDANTFGFGDFNLAGVVVYNRVLTSGELLLQSQRTDFGPESYANLYFSNDMLAAATCNVNEHGSGGNFTSQGTMLNSTASPDTTPPGLNTVISYETYTRTTFSG